LLLVALGVGAVACSTKTGGAVLCLPSDPGASPAGLTLDEGATATVEYAFISSGGDCDESDAASMSLAVTSDAAGVATASPATQALRVAPGGLSAATMNDPDRLVGAVVVTGVAPGTTTLRFRVTWPQGSPPQDVAVPVFVRATRGTINVVINGLPAGVNGNVRVGSVLAPLRTFTASGTLTGVTPNPYPWAAANVTGPDGRVYVPSPVSGAVEVTAGGTVTITVTYAAQVATTGTINLQVAGNLPTGTNADVSVTGPGGFTRTVTGSGTLADLTPGTYTVTTREVVTPNRDFGASGAATQQVTVTAAQTVAVLVTYATLRRLVQVSMTGTLAPGVPTEVRFTQGGTTRTVTSDAPSVKLPLGTHTVSAPDRILSGRTYRPVPDAIAAITILDAADPLTLAITFWVALEQFDFAAQMAILIDPFAHAGFVQMWATAVLTYRLTFLNPPPAGVARQTTGAIAQLEVTGQAPFVRVIGFLNADRTFSLTGNSGASTVAGYANVPAGFTGSLSASRVLTNGEYRLGQTAPPTGLPNGPITYRLTGTAQP
jgi:hypothetical protein